MDERQTKPVVFNYLNLSQYLTDLYHYRKDNESSFSYESWSFELELNNRNLLRLIVLGRRNMTDRLTVSFIKRMNLSQEEAAYFRNLVLYSQSKTLDQKKFYSQQLAHLCPSSALSIKLLTEYEEFVSDPFLPKLYTLLGFNDIKQDLSSLAHLTRESEERVQSALNKLKELGLLTEKNGNLQAVEKNFKVSDHLGSTALQNYHTLSLKQAIKSHNLPLQLRRFRSLLIALSEEELAEVFQEMNAVAKTILQKNQSDQLQNRRLFQFNMNVYPISEKSS